MKRRHAIFLAVLWVVALIAGDLWCIIEYRVADAHLNRALAELFEAPVSFGELSLGPTLDLVINDVRLMRPDQPRQIYGTIDEIRITPRWDELLTRLKLDVKEIAVRNPTLVVKWKKDRTFDMPSPLRSDLEARTRTMGELPAIKLDGLTLVLDHPPDFTKRSRENIIFDQLAITLAPEGSARWLYRFDIDLDHPLLGHLVGGGRFNKNSFEVHLKHQGLSVSSELVDTLKPDLAKILGDLTVDGELTLSAEIGPVAGGGAEALSAALDCQGMNVRSKEWGIGLSEIQGRIEFTGGVLNSPGITAKFEGAPVEVRGKVDLSGASRVVDLRGQIVGLPVTNAFAARIRKLPGPCATVADQIEAWDPDGFADVNFRLEQDRDEKGVIDIVHPFFDVEFRGGSKLRYIGHVGEDGKRHGFAYPLEDLRGVLKFTDKFVVFERLTAMNGSLAVEARGRIDYEHAGEETYDVDVDAHGLRLDQRVSAALSGGSRDLFNSLDAEGSVDLTVTVKRKKGEPPGPRVDIGVELQGVALSPKPLPLDFADARGRVLIPDTGPIKIEKVSARRSGGSIFVSGEIPVVRGRGALDLSIRSEKFPVDAALGNALREMVPDAADTLLKLNPTGRVDGTLHVSMAPNGTLTDLAGTFAFEDMTLAPEDPSVRIEDLDGSIGIEPSKLTINAGTTASVAGEHFAVKGTVSNGSTLDISIEAENFHIDRELLADVEPLVPWIRRSDTRPELNGPMSISVHVSGQPSDPIIAFELDMLGVDLIIGSIPGLRFDGLKAHCSMTPAGVVSFRDVSARIPLPAPPGDGTRGSGAAGTESRPEMVLSVTTGGWTPAAKATPTEHGRLTVGASTLKGIQVTPGLMSLLPLSDTTKQRLVELAPTASLDLTLGKVVWENGGAVITKSQLTGSQISFGAERPVQVGSMTIRRLQATAGSGLLDATGEFVFRDCRFFDVPVPAMVGEIAVDAVGIRFKKVEADLFAYEQREGKRFPLGKINPELSSFGVSFDDGSFSTTLRLVEVNLPAALRALGGNPGQVAGVFRANIDDFRGIIGDSSTYEGRGGISIRARNVVSLPVFYKMFNSLDVLAIFDRKDPWTKIDVGFDVARQVVNMKPMRIDAPDVMLEGPGTLTFGGIIKADLKANQGVGISPIGWVTRLISHVVFSGVRIEGPISDPKVDAYSLTGG